MNTSQVRAYLALGVVGISMIVVAVLATFPFFKGAEFAPWADVIGKMVSPFVGIIGVIIGYYFGQKDDPQFPPPHRIEPNKAPEPTPGSVTPRATKETSK